MPPNSKKKRRLEEGGGTCNKYLRDDGRSHGGMDSGYYNKSDHLKVNNSELKPRDCGSRCRKYCIIPYPPCQKGKHPGILHLYEMGLLYRVTPLKAGRKS